MEGREAAQELQYYRTMEKERRRWEEREERLLSRLEATPAPESDRKLGLSIREKEALTKELLEVKDRLENVLLAKESLSQQLEVAEQGKVEAEEQIEEQQLRIEELQAGLQLAEVRAKRVELDTLTKPGGESTMDGMEQTRVHLLLPSVGPLWAEPQVKPLLLKRSTRNLLEIRLLPQWR